MTIPIDRSTTHHRRAGAGAALATCLLATVLGAAPALAAAGDLDPAFGTGGTVTTSFPGGSYASAVAIRPDGRIVAVGGAAGGSGTGEFAVVRYATDGSLDASFDGDGMVTTPIAGGGDDARSVAIQPNGKMAVAGTDSGERFAVVRYLADGSLDDSFGGDGIVRTNLTSGTDVGADMVIQADGRIVVVGPAGQASRFALVRYRSDGTLDPKFGDGGKVIGRRGVPRAVALQPDGKIVVTGYDVYGLVVARFLPDGTPDPTFSGDGVVRRVSSEIFPLDVAVQANGRIVVGGDFDIFAFGLARFTVAGNLDPTFGDGGTVRAEVGSGEQAVTGLAIQADGKIVAVGHIGPHEAGDPVVPAFAAARFLRNGTLDTAFGGDGTITTEFDGGASASGVAIQADGKIVAVGGAGADDTVAFALARYLA
jgi:uncharacterized delta-60 repeat protein